MNELFGSPVPPAMAVLLFVLPLLSAYLLWKIRRSSGESWLRWNRVAPLPLTTLEMGGILGGVWACMTGVPVLLPVLVAGCALVFTQRHGLILALQWGLEPARYPAFLRVAFVSYVACILPVVIATTLSFVICRELGYTDLLQNKVREFEAGDRRQMIEILLSATLFAPLWEEMFFRGLVYPWLKSRVPQKSALILSALFFASIHFHIPSFLPLAVLGLVLAFVYEYTGSIVTSIALHAIFNFATCLNLILLRQA